jgi:hypothetical protein
MNRKVALAIAALADAALASSRDYSRCLRATRHLKLLLQVDSDSENSELLETLQALLIRARAVESGYAGKNRPPPLMELLPEDLQVKACSLQQFLYQLYQGIWFQCSSWDEKPGLRSSRNNAAGDTILKMLYEDRRWTGYKSWCRTTSPSVRALIVEALIFDRPVPNPNFGTVCSTIDQWPFSE